MQTIVPAVQVNWLNRNRVFGRVRDACQTKIEGGGTRRLLNGNHKRILQLVETCFAICKVIRNLRRIANIEPGGTYHTAIGDVIPNGDALFVPNYSSRRKMRLQLYGGLQILA